MPARGRGERAGLPAHRLARGGYWRRRRERTEEETFLSNMGFGDRPRAKGVRGELWEGGGSMSVDLGPALAPLAV